MWEKSKSSSGPSIELLEQETAELVTAAKKYRDRYLYESELYVFIHSVKLGQPIPDSLMHFVADMTEELISAQNIVKVSDVLGVRPKGSLGKKSLEKDKQNKKIAQIFALYKQQGMSRVQNLSTTANTCGVSPRTVERVIRDYAKTQPMLKYRPNDKI